MNLLERARIEAAVQSYDLWLDLRGARGRRRRDLRRELRANLVEASARVGAREAVDRLGSTRAMATEAIPIRAGRPRWNVGGVTGVVVFALVVLAELLSALAWTDGVMAAAPAVPAAGSLTLFPGTDLTYSPEGSGFAVTYALGWLAPAVGALVFVLVARPWRALRRETSGPGA